MMTHNLVDLKTALQQPFAPQQIGFLIKDIRQEHGKWTCLALPYANKRVYEDRLNELVFGEWSTPSTLPFTTGNKLIIPVAVTICGVTHTDYGEAFVTITSQKNGAVREDENTATEAYSQAFRRACAKFGLGRYLYDLPKLRLPYDPQRRQLAITSAERIAGVEKLYKDNGLLTMPPTPPTPSTPSSTPPTPSTPSSTPPTPRPTAPRLQVVPQTPHVPTPQASHSQHPHASHMAVAYPDDMFLDWVAEQVNRDPTRIQGICDAYQVRELAHLSEEQRQGLTKRLQHQRSAQQGAQHAQQRSQTTSAAPSVPLSVQPHRPSQPSRPSQTASIRPLSMSGANAR